MPPRRSCFQIAQEDTEYLLFRFNATTAFLLPLPAILGLLLILRFNATTAFLLPSAHTRPSTIISDFNATTAFLLRGVAAFRVAADSQFQCHHGVPASPPPPGRGSP